LAFAAGLGAVGIWIGFSIAVGTFAVLLVWRFHRLSEDGRPLLGIL
jgi:MATE family multidrug resistance protein